MCGGKYHDHSAPPPAAKSRKSVTSKAFDPGPKQEEEDEKKDEPEQGSQTDSTPEVTSYKGAHHRVRELV